MYLKLPINKSAFILCLLAMSTLNYGGAQDLTQEELVLHHYAAMVKRDLDAYHTKSRSQEDLVYLLKNHLARFVLLIHFYKYTHVYLDHIDELLCRCLQEKPKTSHSRSPITIEPRGGDQFV